MKFKTHRILIVLVYIFLSRNLAAQDSGKVIPINLASLLEMAGANNLTIQEYRQRQELAQANLTTAKEWWLPELYAGLQAHQLTGAAMNADGRFFLDVDRRNFWSGLGLNASWDFAEGILLSKTARLQSEAALHLSQSERNKVLLESIDAYYNLMTAQNTLQAYQQLIGQSDTIAQQLEVLVDAGMRYQSELLLAKSNLNHLKVEMLYAQKAVVAENARLRRMLNLKSDVKLITVDTLLVPLADSSNPSSNLSDTVLQNRPEIISARKMLEASMMQKRLSTTALLFPNFRINTYGAYFGGLFNPVRPMFPENYPNTKTFYPTTSIDASLLWKLPIGTLVSGGRIKQANARILIQKTKVQQIEAMANEELSREKEQLSIIKEQLEITDSGRALSKAALSQSIQRERLGTVKPFEVLQAQEMFMKAQLDYLKAVADYNTGIYRLRVAAGGNL